MASRIIKVLLPLLAAIFVISLVTPADATTQWSRKYGMSCNSCHSIFPRLNSYGDRFLWNGYQDPDSDPDGDKVGKKELGSELVVDDVNNFLGVRLNLTPFKMTTKDLRVEQGTDKKEDYETRYTFGNTDWFQLFWAGSITRYLSIFIEAEHVQGGFKFNWFYMGFHRLYGTMVNFQLGNISALEFASYPDRLPQLPAAPKSKAFALKTSGGATGANIAEDPLDMRSARHGAQWYGWNGPVTLWAGITPGGNATGTNPNNTWGYWVGSRYDVPEEMADFAGSNATIWYMGGTDAANTSGAAPGDAKQHTNAFSRITPQFNLRTRGWDVQFAYAMGKEDNYKLVHPDSSKTEFEFSSITLVAGYQMGKWFPALQYDQLTAPDFPALDSQMLTPAITYLWRENIRYTLYTDLDLREEVLAADATGDKPAYYPKNNVYFNIRVMF
ncbi:MAG: hypothetical protein FJY67_08635 [Calditrichaeota bacterium]|nr:hypothetical protein [Calditrichota bacterium]